LLRLGFDEDAKMNRMVALPRGLVLSDDHNMVFV